MAEACWKIHIEKMPSNVKCIIHVHICLLAMLEQESFHLFGLSLSEAAKVLGIGCR